MKIKKGDMLAGVNPHSKKKQLYKYLGKTKSKMLLASGFKYLLKPKGSDTNIIVTTGWAIDNNLKVVKRKNEK